MKAGIKGLNPKSSPLIKSFVDEEGESVAIIPTNNAKKRAPTKLSRISIISRYRRNFK